MISQGHKDRLLFYPSNIKMNVGDIINPETVAGTKLTAHISEKLALAHAIISCFETHGRQQPKTQIIRSGDDKFGLLINGIVKPDTNAYVYGVPQENILDPIFFSIKSKIDKPTEIIQVVHNEVTPSDFIQMGHCIYIVRDNTKLFDQPIGYCTFSEMQKRLESCLWKPNRQI